MRERVEGTEEKTKQRQEEKGSDSAKKPFLQRNAKPVRMKRREARSRQSPVAAQTESGRKFCVQISYEGRFVLYFHFNNIFIYVRMWSLPERLYSWLDMWYAPVCVCVFACERLQKLG